MIQYSDWEWHSPWDEFLEGTSIHLGKSSLGWKFCWNFHNNQYYSNKKELLAFIRSGRVVDEYGTTHNTEEFIEKALNWGSDQENSGWVYNEEYVIAHFDKEGIKRPFTADEKYYDTEIDGLRVSRSTEFS
jgi:predicted nucleic acid-binding protein